MKKGTCLGWLWRWALVRPIIQGKSDTCILSAKIILNIESTERMKQDKYMLKVTTYVAILTFSLIQLKYLNRVM